MILILAFVRQTTVQAAIMPLDSICSLPDTATFMTDIMREISVMDCYGVPLTYLLIILTMKLGICVYLLYLMMVMYTNGLWLLHFIFPSVASATRGRHHLSPP